MRKKFSHNVGIHNIGFIMFYSYKITLYMVLLSAVDGELLLFPVRHYLILHIQDGQ